MTIEMAAQHTLANLLETHMKRASIGDARLANQVNSIADNPYFIHRSTVRNWRTGSSQKVNSWRQLATVAVALGLNRTEANLLLESGGCPSIQALTATARESDQALLAFWQEDRIQPAVLPSLTEEVGEDSNLLSAAIESEKQNNYFVSTGVKRWKFVGASVIAIAFLVAVFRILSPGNVQSQVNGESSTARNMLINSNFEEGTAGWIAYVNKAAVANFTIIDMAMHIRIGQTARKSWHITLNQKGLEVTAGKTYTTRFRVRGDGVTSMQVDLTRVVDPKTTLSFENSGQQIITTTDHWTTKTIEFKAIETMSLMDGGARLLFKFGKSEKGWMELDDVELFEGKAEL